MQKPLSESLQKIRRAQRALIFRRKRRRSVRVTLRHSAGSYHSTTKADATRRASRQLMSGYSIGAAREKESGPCTIFGSNDCGRPQEDGHCLGSLYRRNRGAPKVDFEDNPLHSIPQVGENLPYWGELPDSPVRSPPKAQPQYPQKRSEDGDTGTDHPSDKSRLNQGHGVQFCTGKAVSCSNINPRQPVLPTTNNEQRAPPPDRDSFSRKDVRLEAVRRSLSQQEQLSSLVPRKNPGRTGKATPLQQDNAKPLPEKPRENHRPSQGRSFLGPRTTSDQQTILDKFTKELEEFARNRGVAGKATVSTTTASETHVSVHTVQELLPYRQQFRDAGLAVTSEDQKAPGKQKAASSNDSPENNHPKLGKGVGLAPYCSTSTSSEQSSNKTVIHLSGNDTVSMAPIDNVSTKFSDDKPERPPGPHPLASIRKRPISSKVAVLQERKSKLLVSLSHTACVLMQTKPPVGKPEESGDPQKLGEDHNHNFQHKTERDLAHLPTQEGQPITEITFSASTGIIPKARLDKNDKSLPSLPPPRTLFQSRYGGAFSNKTLWGSSIRPLPRTIAEEKEPSPEKEKLQVPKSPTSSRGKGPVMQTQSKKVNVTEVANTTVHSSLGGKLELTGTWKHAVGTPFEKALDDIVRKLEDMEDKKPAVEPDKFRPQSKRTSPKPASPSQRLQRAAAMRRQRLAGAMLQQAELVDNRGLPTASNISPRSSSRPASRNPVLNGPTQAKVLSIRENVSTHDDNNISDKDVLKGLKIMCAASADQELDAWIRSKTGLRLRRFLADLRAFEELSENGMAAMDGQRARRRRAERRRAQAKRDSSVRRSLKR